MIMMGKSIRHKWVKSVLSFSRDETKQEEMWKQTIEYLKEHFTEEEIFCLEGADPANT